MYKSAIVADAQPQYVVSRAHMGNIVQTVTGTGQVSATNQLDVASQVSGTIESINVSVGEQVHAGQLLGTIDPTNALNTLTNAKISLAKLTEAPKTTDISNAENSIEQSYTNAYNAASTIYLDMPNIVAGMKDLLYGQTGFISDQRSSYLSSTARTYRDTAGTEYDAAVNLYQASMTEFNTTSRSSATSTVNQMLSNTSAAIKAMTKAVSDTQTALTFITTTQPDYYPKDAPTAQTNVNSWSSQINSDLSSLVSAQNSIDTSSNAYTNLITGADHNDIQSAMLSVDQAQQTYNNYFIRAPFDGVIGRIPVNAFGQAGNGTVIATVVGNQKIATRSLDEVDAATVKTGDPVSLTFNAINNFTATGTVSEIDSVGVVASGVVSYSLKVGISTLDTRINPGMSVNATITTNELDNILVVPSAAVKTQGNRNYVQIFTTLPVTTTGGAASSTFNGAAFAGRAGRNVASTSATTASSTYPGGGQLNGNANVSTTSQYGQFDYGSTTGSTTRQFGGNGSNGTARNTSVTVTSATPPQTQVITTGITDGTNTQISSGLTPGAWVVTKTIAASAVQTATAAPSLLSSLGAGGARGGFGGGGGGGGAARTTTTAPAAARPTGN